MRIKKIGVVGAGTMGGGIASLAASAGLPVVLLDIPGDDDRSGPAKKGLERALKARPAAFMSASRARLVRIGNTEDDLEMLADCDLVVEAIIELPDPKKALYARLETVLRNDAIVATNTSGIPIRSLAAERSEGFRRRFLGAHFFNPPRYLHLLELIPTDETDPAVLETLRAFGERILGKGVVVAKDRPGFIANRLGVHTTVVAMRLMEKHDLTIDEVDTLNGPLVGRPKSATYRTADLTGLDVLKMVGEQISAATGEDLRTPAWVDALVARGRLGEKTGAGFYTRQDKQILTLDLRTGEYVPQSRPDIPGLGELQGLPLAERLAGVLELDGKYGAFARELYAQTWHYAAGKASEIAYDLPSVDQALEWGYGFEMGPFRQMDAVGLTRVRELFAAQGLDEPELLRLAGRSFYRENGMPTFVGFDGRAVELPERRGVVRLDRIRRSGGVLEEGREAAILDLGDGVVLLEFRSKMGTLGEDVLKMLGTALDLVEREGRPGLVVSHEDPRTFSAGANLVLALEAAKQKRWDTFDAAIRTFQGAFMRVRYAPFPVVVAPFGLTLGGGAEMSLHSDLVQAHAELYMGLVEVGVGLLPGAGGTKELLFRFTEELAPYEEADPFEAVRRAFGIIAMGKTSGSALEAREMGLLRASDRISMNRDHLIADAKARVLDLAPGYVAPVRGPITALGNRALGNLRYAIWAMREAEQITDHDVFIGSEVAYVLCGGDGDPREVSEQDILDLEREAFLRLLGTQKTQERIAYTLETGKTLRN